MLNRLSYRVALGLCFLAASFCSSIAAESDFQSWNVVRYDHRWNDKWSGELQYELRLKDNADKVDERIYKPSFRYHFNEKLSLGIGFKYIDRPSTGDVDDKDPWQEITYKYKVRDFSISHSSRLEQRFRKDFSGILPRIRYVFSVSHPIDNDWYWAASEEIRFNLVDKDVGPINGFEQNRIYGGIGYKLNDNVKIELGYLWRYERQRTGPDSSDHVLRFQFLVSTDQRKR